MHLAFLIIVLLASNFVLANTENFTTHNGNQTIQISIKPNITVEPQNLTKLENLVEKLTSKPDWSWSDVIIASSTIVAFFTFGSFLVLRFEGENKHEKYVAMRVVLMSVALIQMMHLGMIGAIIANDPSLNLVNLYLLVIFLTVILIIRILFSILKIHELTENEAEKKGIQTEDIVPFLGMLTKAEEDRDNAIRDLKKAKQESGY